MAALNYAEFYSQALQQRYAIGLRFSALYNAPANETVRWINAQTVNIPRIDTTGMVDYSRDTIGAFARNVNNDWEPKTLGQEREWSTLIAPMDIDETNLALSIANFTRVFNDEQKIPEMDKYMASKLHSEYLSYGGQPVTTGMTTANILSIFDDMMEQMDEAEVPQDGRLLYVTPAIDKMLKQADQIQRQMMVTANNGQVSRAVRTLEEVQIIVVPSVRMKTAYDFTVGAVPAVGAEQINMILIHPTALVSPQKYEFADLTAPAAHTKGKWLWFEHMYWDVFLFERKVPGVKMHVTP